MQRSLGGGNSIGCWFILEPFECKIYTAYKWSQWVLKRRSNQYSQSSLRRVILRYPLPFPADRAITLADQRLTVKPQMVKPLPAVQKTQGLNLEKGTATTPVFLPGESRGQRSQVGYSPWGRTESDTTE